MSMTLGPAFDLVENGFSLAMLTDPFGFPAWWATAHMVASWLKIALAVAVAVPVIGLTLVEVALRVTWALAHGLASLRIGGMLTFSHDDSADRLRAELDTLYDGIAAP